MINLFYFYPWIYLYAQLNPRFPRFGVPNLLRTRWTIRWSPSQIKQ